MKRHMAEIRERRAAAEIDCEDGPRHIGALAAEIVERAQKKQLENKRRNE